MQRLPLAALPRPLPLCRSAATRALEAQALARLPPHTLMQRAGLAVYRLGRALVPHARSVWVACGGGNNGGDGLVAALAWHRHLTPLGGTVQVGWLGDATRLPPDARAAYAAAQAAGVAFVDTPPARVDLAVDALLGLGLQRPMGGALADASHWLQNTTAPVLCVDLPSGLDPDTGRWLSPAPCRPTGARHTLALLTLKPGLFTGHGRTACGELWFDDLDVTRPDAPDTPPDAWLHPAPAQHPWQADHASHKGSRGNLLVIGGQDAAVNGQGMTGAAVLAARAGLHAGAGRVYVGLLGRPGQAPAWAADPLQPELMFRPAEALAKLAAEPDMVSVCGCGGGVAVANWLPSWLARSPCVVLDADGLNAVAADPALQALLSARATQGHTTVLTPHPLEAARLLGCDTATVQADRLAAAQALAERTGTTVVLKGSGSVVAAPGQVPRLNPTGNGLLATAGTGDVLAGWVGARLCRGVGADRAAVQAAVADAVHAHGLRADQWPDPHTPMTASDLIGLPRS
ncbi:NAD(P)H-hydrate dehydratase [Aquabacterium sp. A08]|uniref:NAD(P)H-hydrate dehydratase n=1 Tax=Aquabacterium sp. A08 TaxID=2718532 RepID=UPI0014214629|nr:NAD(P)H-hydrate dehydratase [Aquabacterium sp. A08]NIC40381.1 NAD(P)H-hydrate dehydratase [Aquabacterium sp. A08]